ncbi:MAG: PD40 domain-containing protein, partial [Anaerolinea sp.]|nr:PD40 domain-containing protein [Anaerolinea sp.]
ALIVAGAVLVINALIAPPPDETPSIAESAPTGLPTNTPDSDEALPTLTPLPRTGATEEVAPVGVVPTPALDQNLETLLSGTVVYFAQRGDNFDIYRMTLPQRIEIRLTNDEAHDVFPVVSPDGERIAFMSDRDGDYDIYVMNMNGGSVRRITTNDVDDRTPAWSPDGNWIIYASDVRDDGTDDIYRVRIDGSGAEEVYSDGNKNSQPRYSPDGDVIAFVSGEPLDARTWEIKRLDVDSGDVTTLTANEVSDSAPVWTFDGDVIYVSDGEGHAALRRMEADGSGDRLVYDSEGYDWGVAAHPNAALLIFTADSTGRDELYVYASSGRTIQQLTSGGAAAAWWVVGGDE